jgi:hypothetical protein
MKRILFITNGHGEDIVAAQIIKELNSKNMSIDVLPVVGKGDAFKGLNVNIVGPRKALPSGGFGLRNYSYLIKDIFAGLIAKVMSQIKTLNKNKWSYSLVIGIGDIVPIIYSMLTGCKFIFIGVNKSEYYKKLAFNYTWIEKKLLKDNCELTLARDGRTAKALALYGINAKYVGNPMMDAVQNIRRSGHQEIRGKKTIGFLPGTREDAYKNIDDFCRIAWQTYQINKKVRFILSMPQTLDRKKLSKIKIPLNMKCSGNFKDVLSKSSIIIGLSGTGNEQAAGIGLPVIAFPGRGAQFNSRFAHGQKELLGNALHLLPRRSETIAKEVIALLKNRRKIVSMGRAGKKRMGGPGATKQIANIISGMINR